MIDYFSLALTHGLILIALYRLLTRDDLDEETDESAPLTDTGDMSTGDHPRQRQNHLSGNSGTDRHNTDEAGS
ncbi:MAG: hypothetical protein ACK5NN_06975 [Sphingomonadaceae bacterium]